MRRVLVTGGTGSFGRAFVRLLLDEGVESVTVFSRDEGKHHDMLSEIPDRRVAHVIGDVRDRGRVRVAVRGADVVVHAAAMKQIPFAESDPSEVVETNIHGSSNVAGEANEAGIPALALSSDKAVEPLNVYGATKLCMERVFVRLGHNCVRYGNVMDSRGSVLPLWRAQSASGGPITVTDPRMTRFWLTLWQAAHFVLSCLHRPPCGSIFVPILPTASVADLAEVLAPGIPLDVRGIRPGEKMHEVLVCESEAPYCAMDMGLGPHGAYVLTPWSKPRDAMPYGFRYSSDGGHGPRLTPGQILGMLTARD